MTDRPQTFEALVVKWIDSYIHAASTARAADPPADDILPLLEAMATPYIVQYAMHGELEGAAGDDRFAVIVGAFVRAGVLGPTKPAAGR